MLGLLMRHEQHISQFIEHHLTFLNSYAVYIIQLQAMIEFYEL